MRTTSTTGRLSAYAAAAASVLALGAALLAAKPARSQEVTLRMHTFVPPVSGSYKSLAWWVDKVQKESGGKIKINLFGSMQLGGKAEDLYDQTKNGVVDIGWMLPGYKAGLFPATSAFELPFIGIGAPASIASPALDDYIRKWAKKEWQAVHVIVAHSSGMSVLHMKEKPIKKLEDFKGLKLRTPSRISSAALDALGATPVPIPGLKMTEVLMRNVVDGVVTPWAIAMAIRTIDVVNHHAETSLHEPTLVMMMNKQSYAKLPPALKKVIDANSGAKIAAALGKRWERSDLPAIAKAKKLKHNVYKIPEAEERRWRAATKPVYDAWVKEMDSKGMPGRQMLEDAERLIEKYKAQAKAK